MRKYNIVTESCDKVKTNHVMYGENMGEALSNWLGYTGNTDRILAMVEDESFYLLCGSQLVVGKLTYKRHAKRQYWYRVKSFEVRGDELFVTVGGNVRFTHWWTYSITDFCKIFSGCY